MPSPDADVAIDNEVCVADADNLGPGSEGEGERRGVRGEGKQRGQEIMSYRNQRWRRESPIPAIGSGEV